MYIGPPSGPEYHPFGCGECTSQAVLRDPSMRTDDDALAQVLAADRIMLGESDLKRAARAAAAAAAGELAATGGKQAVKQTMGEWFYENAWWIAGGAAALWFISHSAQTYRALRGG